MKELYTMSQQEVYKLEVLARLLNKQTNQLKASELLGISVRQVQRLIKAYKTSGAAGLISKKRGKSSNNRVPDTVKDYAITLIKRSYNDFGPTLAAEKLSEKHNVNLSVETVRTLMTKADIWVPRSKRHKRSYQPRYRRECFGELIQIDGSTHHWFEDRGPKCTLLVYVDDATSKITSLYFAPSESMHTYSIATKQHLDRYGKPVAFYSDKFSVFRATSTQYKHKGRDEIITQFGRALYELNIDLICANTCQAKGRVERANLTLQDRLVKELRLNNISTIDEANLYLPTFIEDYNKRFGKSPQHDLDMHRSLKEHEDLYETLCIKEERTVTNNLTIQYDRILYLIEDSIENRELRRNAVMVHEYYDGGISLNHKGRKLEFRQLYDRVNNMEQGRVISSERIADTLILIKKNQEAKEHEQNRRMAQVASIPNERIADTLALLYQREKPKEYKRSSRCLSRRHLQTKSA